MPNTDFSDNHPHFTFDERNAALDKVREALTSDSALLQDYINHAYKKRHGMSMNHSQQTTRLMTEDGTVKHQLPKINAAAGIAELNASCDQQEKPRTTVSSEMEKRNGLADM
uniref:Transposase n=1 Tax=Rhabditophanes sp. KR3021 TaxID=114890 RepID=A0AC35UEP8_9BILA